MRLCGACNGRIQPASQQYAFDRGNPAAELRPMVGTSTDAKKHTYKQTNPKEQACCMGFLRKPNARRLRRVRPPPWEASHTTGCRVFPPAWNGGIGAFSPPTSDRRCDAAGSDRMQKAAARESFARKTRRAKEKPPASAGPRLGASSGRSAVMRAAEKNRPLDVRAQAARARGGTVPTRRLCRNVDIVALLIGICRQWFDT